LNLFKTRFANEHVQIESVQKSLKPRFLNLFSFCDWS
jgi:hypothetical protein